MVAHRHWYQTSECIASCCVGTAILLDCLVPIQDISSPYLAAVGTVLVVGSVVALAWCQMLFRRSGESTKPGHSTKMLVTTGLYQWSRNPIYVSVVVCVLSAGLIVGSIWIDLSAFVTAWFIRRLLILPEEAYLEKNFDGEYVKYKQRVRRWL